MLGLLRVQPRFCTSIFRW